MHIYLDIETLPSCDPAAREAIAAEILPPANYSKPETIAKWEAETKPALVDEALRKTSFDGAMGRVLCIGYAFDDQAPEVVMGWEPVEETRVLMEFFGILSERLKLSYSGGETSRGLTVIGHNVSWDLRFIWKRAVVHRVKPPSDFRKAVSAKPWGTEVADTMLMWDADRTARISLDKLCKALGVQGKDGMDGSQVHRAWMDGQHARIADYCKADVQATRECYRRMLFAA